MSEFRQTKLFLVDDDPLFLRLLCIEFAQLENIQTVTFTTGEQCLSGLDQLPDIIILDYHLNGLDPDAMNGLDTLDRIKMKLPDVPVIMLSAQDQIEVAISCLHHGAYDYVVKSETYFMRLQKIISTILSFNKMAKDLNWYIDRS
jgi:CheY-like chemotaxis protein